MKSKLRLFVPVQVEKIIPRSMRILCLPTAFVMVLLCAGISLFAQQKLQGIAVKDKGGSVELNFHSFPEEIMSAEVWGKANPGKKFNGQARYKIFPGDSVKYVEVTGKRTAYESFYINPADPAAFSQVKGQSPINFQRKGEWVSIDRKLRSLGNGVFEAPDQWDSVGINLLNKESYIRTPEGKVAFNNWSLFGINAGNKVLLAKADWSNYTIGEDGMRIINIFPGIDAELSVRRGGIKTSFIVHRLLYTQYEGLYFEDSFNGLSNEGLYFSEDRKEDNGPETVHARVASLSAAIKISHAFAYAKKEPSITTELPFNISGNKLGFTVYTRYLADHLVSGDVIIDPLVESINSMSQSLVGFMYNASCGFANSCDYTISVTPPANATITGIAAFWWVQASAPCNLNNFGWQMVVGGCTSPAPGVFWWLPWGTGPGVWQYGFINEDALLACAPAPSCTPVPLDVTAKLFRGCVGPTGCDNTCISHVEPFAIRIEGRTLELTPIVITPNDSLCLGQNFTFNTAPAFGVPAYSAVSWSLDPSGTPSIGTGNTITTGAALTAGEHTIYANVTDACGVQADASAVFQIIHDEVETPAGQTICNGASVTIPLLSNYLGSTTYDWTVVQTGVTGASNGSGTFITQTLYNYSSTPGTATYTITPSAFGCPGTPAIHTVTVDPVSRVLYVDDLNGNDANCGNSWGAALKTVSKALQLSTLSTNVDSILVAAGTYYPTGVQNGTNRDSSFVIADDGLKLYGGYPNGGGTRNIAANPTILSGDIGALGDSLDNSYHVMVLPPTAISGIDSIIVDGFTITKGNANGGGTFTYETIAAPRVVGGGIYIRDNNDQTTVLRNLIISQNTASIVGGGINILIGNPLIQNCEFRNNRAVERGGGICHEDQSRATIVDCRFIDNWAYIHGGGAFNFNTTSRPRYTRCDFISNMAGTPTINGWGGGMYTRQNSAIIVEYCRFIGNRASSGGGGAICEANSTGQFVSCVFENNIARSGTGTIGSGGGLQAGTTATLVLINCVIANNTAGGSADDGGGGIMVYSGSTVHSTNVTLSGNITLSTTRPNANGVSINPGTTLNFGSSILWGPGGQFHNAGTFNYFHSIVKGLGTPALPNLDLDPHFADESNPAGPDGIYHTADDGLALTECSPAINMGNNIHALTPGDILDNPRIAATTLDMGAYEFQTVAPNILFTDIVKTYGDPDAAIPNVTSCSGLPLTFTIDDINIAEIVGGNLHVRNAGTTTITAHAPNGTPDVTVNLTVNPRPVTISLTATAIIKIYDGNTDATVTAANLQLATGDVLGTDDVVIALSSNIGSYDTKNVGTFKPVTVPLANISLTGTSAANYVIANTTDVSANIGVIRLREITVTANPQTKTYGDADPVLTYTYTPALAPGDVFTGSLERVAGEAPGVYPINLNTLSLNSNYIIYYGGDNLIITPKMITVTADPKTKVYGDADPVLTYTFAPALVGTDVFTGTLTRVPGENVGTYAINRGSLALSTNYTVTYISSNLAITPKAITVTANSQIKVYGDADPALTYTFAPALVGTDVFTGALARIPGENVGTYPIAQGTLGLNTNYNLTYTGSNLIITPKAITVTANPQTKVYGDADPVLTYTFTPALVGTDAFTGTLTRAAGENVGTYAIAQGALALSANYTTMYVPANLVITKAVLTVAANDRTICFGDPVSGLTISYSGFKFTDNAGSLSSQPVIIPPVFTIPGNYPIIPSGGSALNYSFDYVEGQLTVLPSPSGVITQTLVGPLVVTTPGVSSGVQLTAPQGTGYTYEWSTGQVTPTIFVTSNGQFSVIVTNSLGCRTFFTIVVRQQTLIIPNIFSPNGDNINDRWVIENLQNYPGSVIQIFNRYGQAVHKMVNYVPWDGRINGKDMPIGTYYYVIDLKNGQKPISGYIDIIR